MHLSDEEIFTHASHAVERMFEQHGPGHKFPFDAIWQNLPSGVVIPSTKKPGLASKLIAKKFVERTGGQTKTVSELRANTFSAEYRFGSRLVPKAEAGSRPSDLLKAMKQAMESEGYIISAAELANFQLAMMVSPLVILSGISGTGKSLLPRKFARHTKSEFKPVPVQPQWSDNSDLFGYVPTLSPTEFIEGALIGSLVKAKSNPSTLTIALLDEMNLAPVEHYFSDFLSVAETRWRDGATVKTDELPIELPKAPTTPADKYKHLEKIGLPHNLRVVGTANMDESTHAFSPKVLDRAFTIEFDDPDLTAFSAATPGAAENFSELARLIVDPANAISVQEARGVSQDLFEEIAALLQEVQDILAPTGIKFGYRTRDAILLYLHFWRQLGLKDIVTANAALDFCLLQKVLPKVSGSGEALSESLKLLAAWLKKDRAASAEGEDSEPSQEFTGPFARSLQKVERMAALLETDGATHYWGT